MTQKIRNKILLKNTILLYIRILFILVITLYTSRVILNVLGIDDYGIYNVVAGIVTMLSFLSSAMSSATQRFISYELGKNNQDRLSIVFKTCLLSYFIIIVFIIIISETIGVWFLNYKINIPPDRLSAAHWVLQSALISFVFSIASIPYMANIIAHEKMSVYAALSILEATLKLSILFFLDTIHFDKLKLYSIYIVIVSFIIFTLYYLVNRINYSFTKYSFTWNKIVFFEIFSYTGWNLFGNIAAVGVNQGINIILNIFFGPVINAARAISAQLNSAVYSFISSLQVAVTPQIVKSYASNEIDRMKQLVFMSAKYSCFLVYLISLPILLKTEIVLNWWLGSVPDYTVDFVKLTLIDSIIISISSSLMSAFQATGRIKAYQLIVGMMILLNIPLSYYLLSYGFNPNSVFMVIIVISIITLFIRISLLNKISKSIINGFYTDVIFRIILVIATSSLPVIAIEKFIQNSFFGLITIYFISAILIITSIIIFGMKKQERILIFSVLTKTLKYKKNNEPL